MPLNLNLPDCCVVSPRKEERRWKVLILAFSIDPFALSLGVRDCSITPFLLRKRDFKDIGYIHVTIEFRTTAQSRVAGWETNTTLDNTSSPHPTMESSRFWVRSQNWYHLGRKSDRWLTGAWRIRGYICYKTSRKSCLETQPLLGFSALNWTSIYTPSQFLLVHVLLSNHNSSLNYCISLRSATSAIVYLRF